MTDEKLKIEENKNLKLNTASKGPDDLKNGTQGNPIFYFYINKLIIRAYQWFCFFLIIYFLFSSLRVFGTNSFWIDILELMFICALFIHIMFGPKTIKQFT